MNLPANITAARLPIPMSDRLEVARRDGCCFHCRDKDGPWEIDHLQPVSAGGGNDLDNLVLSCIPCNRRKGSKSHSRFLDELSQGLSVRVVAFLGNAATEAVK
ncbi:MAG: putative HNH endonuclease [Prokaryotic dsDNA virus sp.]|nr:MAG: putative HNH endonuclease [Prokaryotic dsDNA virus sp.]|tara:strand:- start:221 stop:529 length:309 start_codon:yes stop_codon:yes gene_type:complete